MARAVKVEKVTIQETGAEGWLYSDGSVRNELGHLLAPHPDGAPPITPANSAEMRQRRSWLQSEAAAQGLLNSARKNVGPGRVPGSLAAWSAAVERLADTYWKDTTKPRDQAELFKAMMLALDAAPARVPVAEGTGAPGLNKEHETFVRMLYAEACRVWAQKKADRGETVGRSISVQLTGE